MTKVIGIVAVVATLFISMFWAYRLGAPKLTEEQAMQAAQDAADRYDGPNSIATQAVLYPGNDLHWSGGGKIPYMKTGCPALIPWFLCPPRSIYVVRVHTPGKGNYDLFVDANTGQSP